MLGNSGANGSSGRDDDALPIDVLKTMVGGAGGVKKQNLTHVEAASITAVDHGAAVSVPAPTVAKAADVQKEFHDWLKDAAPEQHSNYQSHNHGARSSFYQHEITSNPDYAHNTSLPKYEVEHKGWSTPASRLHDAVQTAQINKALADLSAETAHSKVHQNAAAVDGAKDALIKAHNAQQHAASEANEAYASLHNLATNAGHATANLNDKSAALAKASTTLTSLTKLHGDLQKAQPRIIAASKALDQAKAHHESALNADYEAHHQVTEAESAFFKAGNDLKAAKGELDLKDYPSYDPASAPRDPAEAQKLYDLASAKLEAAYDHREATRETFHEANAELRARTADLEKAAGTSILNQHLKTAQTEHDAATSDLAKANTDADKAGKAKVQTTAEHDKAAMDYAKASKDLSVAKGEPQDDGHPGAAANPHPASPQDLAKAQDAYDKASSVMIAAHDKYEDATAKYEAAADKAKTAADHAEKTGATVSAVKDVHYALHTTGEEAPRDAHGRSQAELTQAIKSLDAAKDQHATAAKAVGEAEARVNDPKSQKALQDAGDKAIDKFEAANKAAEDVTSAEGKVAKAKEDLEAAKTDAVAKDGKVGLAEKDLTDAEHSPQIDAAKTVQSNKNYFKTFGKDRSWGVGSSLMNDIGTAAAQAEADKLGQLHTHEWNNVIAGGVTVQHDHDGTVTKSIDKVSNAGSSSTWHSQHGAGAEISTTLTAETGKITEHANGNITRTDAAVAASGSAMAQVSNMGIKLQASASVMAHADASVSHAWKSGDHEADVKLEGSTTGTACAQAGASLGFDGVNLNAGASARIVANVTASASATNGHQSLGLDGTAYATAYAEADTDAHLQLNPFSSEPVEAKCGCNLEAGAGVGLDGTAHLQLADGLSADATAGVHLGEIGVKANVDVSLQHGDLKLNVDVGAALGIGVSVKFDCDINFPKLADDAANAIRAGVDDICTAAHAVGNFFSSIF